MTEERKLLKFRFMAMSKLIGLMAFLFAIIITGFCMFEMHISKNYESMPQLIISVFGFLSIYSGFYISMAKVEHIEEEKTKREKELAKLSLNEEEKAETKKADIDALRESINSLLNNIE